MFKEEIYEEGIVKESGGGIAVISIQDTDKCNECGARIYCKPGSLEGRNLTVQDHYGLNPGDRVRVAIKGSKILAASFLLYGVPLILFLAGILIGMEVFNTNKEIYSFLTGAALTALYIIYLFYNSGKLKTNSYPEIIFVSRKNQSGF